MKNFNFMKTEFNEILSREDLKGIVGANYSNHSEDNCTINCKSGFENIAQYSVNECPATSEAAWAFCPEGTDSVTCGCAGNEPPTG